ncbi:MAG: N-acetylmuramic acid 6-phosphate etherase, partial [Verrucomicrobia bacterium]|nr:N-acetylmuramic acid 6-phosphate etherase [Verrucomicrobiota bacterium]
AVGLGMAGVREGADRARVARLAARIWPGVPCYANHDLETALAAAELESPGWAAARVIVLSGTGSCCYGRGPAERTAKVGGWGHVLGDKGSGYEIGLRALKAIVYYYDRDGVWSRLGQAILRRLCCNEPNDLIGWAQGTDKRQIAALAVEVFRAWNHGDRIARDILAGAADSLARDAASCARRLERRGSPVRFFLTGGVLLKQPRFARWVGREIRRAWPKAKIAPLGREAVWGAVALARRVYEGSSGLRSVSVRAGTAPRATGRPLAPGKLSLPMVARAAGWWDLEELRHSPTEGRNPRSMNLDKLSLGEAIALMLSEEGRVAGAVLAERKNLEAAIRLVVAAFRGGGRLFYVGAGTSGRLGVLDASECPPTFRAPREMVQGIMAGGQQALWESVEGAEDDAAAGAAAVSFRGVRRRDVVVGIAASGRTPFVWGALAEAKRLGAKTILITFNPRLRFPGRLRPTRVIAPDVGPEVLTGSTRLKAGTATKLILNLVTTLSMVRLGKVSSNLMVDLAPTNDKLRDRAVRILCELTQARPAAARAALVAAGWSMAAARRRLGGARGGAR